MSARPASENKTYADWWDILEKSEQERGSYYMVICRKCRKSVRTENKNKFFSKGGKCVGCTGNFLLQDLWLKTMDVYTKSLIKNMFNFEFGNAKTKD